jgi:porin
MVRYPWRQTAGDLTGNLGLITPINDFPGNQNTFAQLTYTQAFPGNKVLVSVGQYPFYNFDGNQYLADQQQNFNNYVLAQNGSSTYPIAGLGAYVQINATSTIQFAAGFQNAADIAGQNLSTKGFGDGGFAWFGYAQWAPKFRGLGPAQYSVTYYQVPTVPLQPTTSGWSVNAVQNLNDTWAVFGRANGAWAYVTPIRNSYALGAAMNNPLGRSPTDQIGLAFGYSEAAPAPTTPAGARNEKVVEAYWNWTFFRGLLLTPDVQYILDPALAPNRDSVWVLGLRATLMF